MCLIMSDATPQQKPLELTHTSFFEGMEQGDIAQFLQRTQHREFAEGELIMAPDSSRDYMYVILSGEAKVHLNGPSSAIIAHLNAGETVGEISLFDGGKPSAYVVAATHVHAIVISSELLWEMVNESHAIARNLVFILSRRIRTGNSVVRESLAQQRASEAQANSDALTGLYNRHWLRKRFDVVDAQSHACFSLIMLDIDHFKRFNDTYGHAVGDDALRLLSQVLVHALRGPDSVARYGGEEFVVLLADTPHEVALQIAERLRKQTAAEPLLCANDITETITISLGVATMLDSNMSAHQLLECADQALYKAKESGRNRVCSYNQS